MRTHRFVAVVALLALAAGCSSDPEPAPAPPPTSAPAGDAAESTAPPPPTVGPAAAGASWPDGVSARLVAVERLPNAWAVDIPASQAIVRLTLEVTNGGQDVLPVVPESQEMTLLYGPNRHEASGALTGYSYRDPAEQKRKGLRADGGTQIPVGGKATFVESSLVPVAELGELAVVVDVPAVDGLREPFTLTGVAGMLKRVK